MLLGVPCATPVMSLGADCPSTCAAALAQSWPAAAFARRALAASAEAKAAAQKGAREGQAPSCRCPRTRRSRRSDRGRRGEAKTVGGSSQAGAQTVPSGSSASCGCRGAGDEAGASSTRGVPPERGPTATTGVAALLGNPVFCADLLARLAPGDAETERLSRSHGVLRDIHTLAMSQGSCRVMQRLLEVAGGPQRDEMVRRLIPWTVQLYESPHGNHVLTRLVEVTPCTSLVPVVEQIQERGCMTVAKHQFGCRVLERLIEHCSEREMGGLNSRFVHSAEELCRHRYGNFVIQSLLEHGPSHRGAQVVQRLLPYLPQLAAHRTASHVVQTALVYAGGEGQRAIVAALLGGASPRAFLDIAASRYGGYVVEDLQKLRYPNIDTEIRRRLMCAGPEHLASPHFHRVLEHYGLRSPAPVVEGTSCLDQ